MPASYTTIPQVILRFGGISSMMTGSMATLSSAHLLQAISAEQATVDLMLARRFPVPFDDAPPIIQSITADLVCYRIITTRGMLPEKRAEGFAEPFKRSLELLKMLAAGSADLVGASGGVIAATDQPMPWSNTMTSTPGLMGQPWDEVDPDRESYWPP